MYPSIVHVACIHGCTYRMLPSIQFTFHNLLSTCSTVLHARTQNTWHPLAYIEYLCAITSDMLHAALITRTDTLSTTSTFHEVSTWTTHARIRMISIVGRWILQKNMHASTHICTDKNRHTQLMAMEQRSHFVNCCSTVGRVMLFPNYTLDSKAYLCCVVAIESVFAKIKYGRPRGLLQARALKRCCVGCPPSLICALV